MKSLIFAPKAHLRSSAKEPTIVPGFASVLCNDSWSCLSAETGCVSNDLEGPKRWGVGICIVLIESGGEVRVLREISNQKWSYVRLRTPDFQI